MGINAPPYGKSKHNCKWTEYTCTDFSENVQVFYREMDEKFAWRGHEPQTP